MKAVVRVFAVIVGLVLLAFIGLFAYLKFVFDPNDFRARLGTLVRDHTGRELAIEGDLKLSVFPWVGIELGAARLGNAAGFSQAPFASIRSAQVRALLMPLLHGQLEVDRVVLEGLALSLERNAQGATNWADLAGAGGERKSEKTPQAGAGTAAALPRLALAGVQLHGASLVWDDRQADRRIKLEAVDLDTGELAPGKPVTLALKGRLRGDKPQLEVALALNGELAADLPAQHFRMHDLQLSVEAGGAAIPGGKASLALTTSVDADLASGKGAVEDFKIAGYGLILTGKATLDGLGGDPQAHGTLALASFSPRELAAALGSPLPSGMPEGVLNRASLDARFEAGPSRIALPELKVQLDDSTLAGRLSVDPSEHPSADFELALDQIDLDRYLPPSGAASKPAAGGGAAAKSPAGVPLPASLRATGEIRIGKLRASGLQLAEVRLPVELAGGRLRLRPTAQLYEGRFEGDIVVDGRRPALGLDIDEKLENVQIGPLTRDLSGKSERITGRARVSAKLRASGADATALKKNLNGTAALNFENGALKGVNLAAMMRQAEALLSGRSAPAEEGPNQTDFSDLSASLQITDGVAHNDDLSLRSPLLRVNGAGSADLPAERIDYRVSASLVGTLTGQGGKPLDKLKGVTVPLRVSGSFEAPKYALDTEALLTENVRQKLEQRKQELREQAGDRLKQELEKGLGKLFR